MHDVPVPFGVYDLVEFAAVGLHYAFTARQDVDLTCNKGTVSAIRLSCIPSMHMCQLASVIHEIPVQCGGGDNVTKRGEARRWG